MARRKKIAAAAEPTFVNADQPPELADEPLVMVYPDPSLPEGSFLAGVGAAGAEVRESLANEWLAAGIATTTPPPAPPASPEV